MPLLALVFLAVPIAELFVIVRSAQAFGVGETLVVLVAISIAGAWLVRREGLGVWRRFQGQLAAGELPHREMVDGVLILFAGALLLTPGFLTDAVGLLLLLPPTRALLRNRILARAREGVDVFVVGGVPGGAGRSRPGGRVHDVDGCDVDGHGPDGPGADGRGRSPSARPDDPPALGRP